MKNNAFLRFKQKQQRKNLERLSAAHEDLKRLYEIQAKKETRAKQLERLQEIKQAENRTPEMMAELESILAEITKDSAFIMQTMEKYGN